MRSIPYFLWISNLERQNYFNTISETYPWVKEDPSSGQCFYTDTVWGSIIFLSSMMENELKVVMETVMAF